MIHNPYRDFEGMDDAYMGVEPSNMRNRKYAEGYHNGQRILEQEQPDTREQQQEPSELPNSEPNPDECDATKAK